MFNINLYKKKIHKIVSTIKKYIENFLVELRRSKQQTSKPTPIKKKLINLDHRIESFFDNFKNLKRFNQSKKKLFYIEIRTASIIGLIILTILTYFILPVFYEKKKIRSFLKNQVYQKYEIGIKINENINYSLFPKPSFNTQNLEISYMDEMIGKVDNAKFYISFSNLFSLKNLSIKDIILKNTEFNINSKNSEFFNKTLNTSKKKEKFVFKKSKLFYKDKDDDLLFLSKIDNLKFYYDDKKKHQKVKSNFKIFNIPFKLDIVKNIYDNSKIIKLSSKEIRLNIETLISDYETEKVGFVEVRLINKNNSFRYKIKKNSFQFFSLDENLSGYLNFKPFFLSTDFYFNYISQKKLFENESLFFDLVDTELLNNPNLNAIFNIKIDKIDKFEFLKDFIFKVKLDNGRIFITNFDANWNNSISIRSNDIEFINDENGKKLIGEIILNFEDVEKFFRYFQIKRNYRDVFRKISSDFVYDFTLDKLVLNNLKIDGKSSNALNYLLEKHNQKDKNIFNKVTLRNFVKKFFQTYAG